MTSQGFHFPAAPKPAQPLIHVWPDPDVVSRYRQTDHAIAAHPVAVLESLLALRDGYRGNAEPSWIGMLHNTVEALRHWDEKPDEADGIVFGNVAAIADALVPQDAVICMDAEFRVKPQMADWEVRDDGKTYRFTLRDGLAWYDGTPVTAQNCVASVKRWLDFDSSGSGIKGLMDGIDVVDDARRQGSV